MLRIAMQSWRQYLLITMISTTSIALATEDPFELQFESQEELAESYHPRHLQCRSPSSSGERLNCTRLSLHLLPLY